MSIYSLGVALFLTAVISVWNGCNKVSFEQPESDLSSLQTPSPNNPPNPGPSPNPNPNPNPPPVICDPLTGKPVGGVGTCINNNGLIGELYYFEKQSQSSNLVYDTQGREYSTGAVGGSTNLINLGFKLPISLVMTNFFIPTRWFTEGFIGPDGNVLTDRNGFKLDEAFALRMSGLMQLSGGLSEGEYEFATISDDGSIVKIDEQNSGLFETLIFQDSNQSTKMNCGNRRVRLGAGSRIPVEVRYFQGPRTEIAFTLVIRKVAGDTPAEPLCNSSTGAWFGRSPNASQDGYDPNNMNSNWAQIQSRGWMVPPPDFFKYVLPN